MPRVLESPTRPSARSANGAAPPTTTLHRILPLNLLAVLASSIRLEILGRLRDRPTDVKTLAEHLDLASDLVSYHLRQLRGQHLVCFEPKKTRRIYSLQVGVDITTDEHGTRLTVERGGAVCLLVRSPMR
jgi:DNA-binding transcriptional ArsR family regulator